MSAQSYFIQLKENSGLSYLQLAKEIGITYQNIMDYKNGNIFNISLPVLNKLAKYENRKGDDILFDIFKGELNDICPDLALKYLCKKYIEGHSLIFQNNYPNPFRIGVLYMDGAYVKKRIANSVTVVQTWESIRKEHWKTFKAYQTKPYHRDVFPEVFVNEAMYNASVLAYAVQRIFLLADGKIKGYDIIFDKHTEEFEYNVALQNLPPVKYTKIQLIKM